MKTSKDQWRAFLRSQRRTWCGNDLQERARDEDQLCLRCEKWAGDVMVGAFVPLPDEPNLWPFLRRRFQQKLPTALPRVDADRLLFHVCDATTCLTPNAWQILEPPPHARCVWPDVVLVPLVGCDQKGTRLGQGKGFYDRFLADLRSQKPCWVLGVAFDCQITEVLPQDPWDEPLDGLLTPSAELFFKPI